MVNRGRCRGEAEPGSVVCRLHGGAAPQVRRRAAERLIMSADHASQKLLEWLDDPEVLSMPSSCAAGDVRRLDAYVLATRRAASKIMRFTPSASPQTRPDTPQTQCGRQCRRICAGSTTAR
jgi:hypothetical protein